MTKRARHLVAITLCLGVAACAHSGAEPQALSTPDGRSAELRRQSLEAWCEAQLQQAPPFCGPSGAVDSTRLRESLRFLAQPSTTNKAALQTEIHGVLAQDPLATLVATIRAGASLDVVCTLSDKLSYDLARTKQDELISALLTARYHGKVQIPLALEQALATCMELLEAYPPAPEQ